MAKQTTLADFHTRHGAQFVEREGWLVAEHFGHAAQEYAAVRSSVGLIDFSHRALLQFTGPDRLAFLQGMLSNDLRALKMFDGQQSAILTQQGKIIADVRVLCAMNSFYLDFWEPLKEKILAHLNRYLVADEVEIVDPNGNWTMLSVQGPQSETLLHEVFGHPELPSQPMGHGMIQFNGSPVCVVRAHHFGAVGFDLVVGAASVEPVAQRLTQAAQQRRGAWIGAQAQNILRVEAGVPLYGVDMSEDNLVLETGLDHSVSFTKGCYLGQEVVERIRSRGHVNKKLVGLLFEGNAAAPANDKITSDGKEIGKITSSVVSPTLGRGIALGYVHKDFWHPGTPVNVFRDGAAIPATVAALPFVQAQTQPLESRT